MGLTHLLKMITMDMFSSLRISLRKGFRVKTAGSFVLTLWGRATHICVGKLIIIGSDNGLSPERRQAIIWTNVGILLIGPLGTNFSEILIEIQTFSLKKTRLKMSSAKCCSFRLGLNVLTFGLQWSIRDILQVMTPPTSYVWNLFLENGHLWSKNSSHYFIHWKHIGRMVRLYK